MQSTCFDIHTCSVNQVLKIGHIFCVAHSRLSAQAYADFRDEKFLGLFKKSP